MPRRPKPWRRAGGAWYSWIRKVQTYLAPAEATYAQAEAELYRILAGQGETPGETRGNRGALDARTLCGLFLDHVKEDRKPGTYEWYRRHLRSFAAAHGDLDASTVRPHHVAAWAGSHGWAPSTRRGAITAVKAAFAWARKVGHLEADPIRDTGKPSPVRREEIPTPEQVRAILAGVHPRFALFLEFLHESGARPGEAARLTAADVQWDRGVAVLQEHKTDRTSKPRVIVLSARAREILAEQAQVYPEGPLFRNQRGNAWHRHAMAQAFARVRKKTGLGHEATAHAFRHRFATDMAKEQPISVVAAILGHASTSTAERYTHMDDELDALRKAVDKARPGEPKSGET